MGKLTKTLLLTTATLTASMASEDEYGHHKDLSESKLSFDTHSSEESRRVAQQHSLLELEIHQEKGQKSLMEALRFEEGERVLMKEEIKSLRGKNDTILHMTLEEREASRQRFDSFVNQSADREQQHKSDLDNQFLQLTKKLEKTSLQNNKKDKTND